MSPTAFHQQLTTLLTTLSNTHSLCHLIRQTRSLGPTTHALDTLESNLSTSLTTIQKSYQRLHTVYSTQLEHGDSPALNSLNQCIQALQDGIEARLAALADGDGKRRKGEVLKPGFGEMTRKSEEIESEVLDILSSLSQRISDANLRRQEQKRKQEEAKKSHPQSKPQKVKTNEVVILIKELDCYIDHMKNSWIEKKTVKGDLFYINAFDSDIKQWEKPVDAFISSLPEKEKKKRVERTNSWEEELKRQVKEQLRKEEEERFKREVEGKLWREQQERIRREEEERVMRAAAKKMREEERIWEEREQRERELRERERVRRQQFGGGGQSEGGNGW